jgi:long-chain acyl-CoA synthetase
LFEHPKVSEAAVLGLARGGDKQNQEIKAYIVPRRGDKPTAEEILAFARTRLPETSVPETIEFRAELPKTFVGKVFKRKLLAEEKK